MQLVSGLAIYFVVWWMVLFTVLPWGASSAHELDEDVDPGSMKAAPVKPRMLLKFGITTIIAGIIFAIIYLMITKELINLDEIPFFPKFRSITD